jgi:DNA-binding GntR family transcriptional regulator
MSGVTRARAAADQLRADMLTGVFLSGERLRELPLAERLGVSQSTIRDALALLEHEGWVIKQPRHGVIVRAFTAAEADDVYSLIGLLVPLAFERVIEPARKPRLRELTDHLDEARRSAGDELTADALGALLGWHAALAGLAGRPAVSEVLDGLLHRAQLLETVREARAPLPNRELAALVSRLADVQRALGMGDLELARRLYAPFAESLRAAAVEALTPV